MSKREDSHPVCDGCGAGNGASAATSLSHDPASGQLLCLPCLKRKVSGQAPAKHARGGDRRRSGIGVLVSLVAASLLLHAGAVFVMTHTVRGSKSMSRMHRKARCASACWARTAKVQEASPSAAPADGEAAPDAPGAAEEAADDPEGVLH
ncbi:MAG: hypothetical protein ACYS22_02360 [Planctomycetota bacterium]|jgi:hypothetical protein